MPITRTGITATSFSLDYQGKSEFVIDAACFPDSSGSPVFICGKKGYADKYNNIDLSKNRLFFLGIYMLDHN